MTVRKAFILLAIIVPAVIVWLASFWPWLMWLLVVVAPLIVLGVFDMLQKKHTILRLYPIIGHLRFVFEEIRPEIQQYFVESNIDGRPVNREFRDLVYQRAKGELDTRPFGTQFDVYRNGYEWVNHSIAPKQVKEHDPRIIFGEGKCAQPYAASPLNISAMSFGSLSRNAILALNKGAKMGGFAHNTGEGGISPYHLKYGADLVWQIGTGYFGCRDDEGNFDPALFEEKAQLPQVRMVEVKLSQGAKPAHGGILPAAKLTPEIADIRRVPLGQDVVSPASHTAFDSPTGLLQFLARLRELSGGKPVGFKLCVGEKKDFLAICKAMLATGLTPDFITVDGGEGGTGAAPIELTNSVGMPLRDALVFVHSALIGIGLRQKIRIIASGKAVSAFHVLRLLALGADTVNSARAMMFALGCIQARKCNSGLCPTGIATQDKTRSKALHVDDKARRVANYHAAMIKYLMELCAAAGLERLEDLRPTHINRRVNGTDIRNYSQLYPTIAPGCLLVEKDIPRDWQDAWHTARVDRW